MKKIIALLIALILGLFSTTVAVSDNVVIDTPAETKVVEWTIGYGKRCRNSACKIQPHNWAPVKRFARRVILAPLVLLLGASMAEETAPHERYWSTLAKGGTEEEAKAAYNAVDDSDVPKPKGVRRISHPRWAKATPKKIGFLSAESLENAVSAKRGWASIAKLNGFTDDTILVVQWFNPDDIESSTEPQKTIKYRGKIYDLHCASQGGVKKGAAIYVLRKFLRTKTNGKTNKELLEPPKGLTISKQNQCKALRFTACEQTKATMKQVIVLAVKRRKDNVSTIVDHRPVLHVDVPNKYKISEATEVEQALDDGFGICGPKCGINTPAAQLRNNGGIKCVVLKWISKHLGGTIIDAFGCEVVITDESIVITTDCTKDIKPFLKKIENGEMSGEAAKAAWLEAQGGPDAPIYKCVVHPQNGRVVLGRQMFGKLSQLNDEALFKVVSKDLGKLAEMGFENGYKKSLQRKYPALLIPDLANALNHPLLYQDTVKSYLSNWHKIASGGIEVNGALALAVMDPDWFDDVYLGGKAVDDPTAGIVAAGTVLFGTSNSDGINPYKDKEVVLGRFPQVKSGLPVVKVSGDAPSSGIIVVSGRPGDMVLQDLDADLDGDKFYIIDEIAIVEAVKKANKIFNFPHIIFSKWETAPADETLVEYLARNAKWQNNESVGVFATHQFVIDEMVPLLKEGEDWKKLLRPTLDENGEWSTFITLEEIFELNILLGVAGNMATDSGKLNHKPDAPEMITKKVAFRPMSQRDAHPNTLDTGFKKRLEAFLPNKFPGVGTDVLRRLHDLLMKFIPIKEVGRDEFNDFDYDDYGRIKPDIPLRLYCPSGFEVIPENVWKHTFGNELDGIKTSLVCYPNDAETVELNADLQVFDSADEGISLVTYFSKYAAKIIAIESNLDDDKKGWTVAGRDTFGDNLIRFVQTAIGRKDVSADDCLWLAYNALCQSFLGTQSQSRGTSFAMSQFLKLFEGMLIQQVCHNTGSKPPKTFGEKVSIKDSVTKEVTEEQSAQIIETTTEEPPFDPNINGMELQKQLLAEVSKETTNEEPPADMVDVSSLWASLKSETFDDELDEEECEDEE